MMMDSKKHLMMIIAMLQIITPLSEAFTGIGRLHSPLHRNPVTGTQQPKTNPTVSTSTSTSTSTNKSSKLNMVGDFFSGITGQAPKSLDVPFERILSGTNIDPNSSNIDVDLQCVYKASKDGWSAIDFHSNCDGRGSGLVVVLTSSGKKIGGFNPLGWQSNDDYGNTNGAFLWFTKGGDNIVKCPVLSGGNAAIFDYASGGPQFGSADLIIGKPEAPVMGGFAGPDAEDTSINAGNLRKGSANFGGAYGGSSFPIGGAFKIVEVEVYCNGNIKQMKNSGGFNLWPF